jgi:hypothetical protein
MIEVKGEQGYAGAFGAMDNAPGQPIILPAGGFFLRDRAAIAQALLERRIPSIAAFRENMEAGALISYGFDLMGLFMTSRVTSSALQRVRIRPTCRSSNRRAFTWGSISRRRLHLAFLYRMCLSLGPTRSANETPRIHHAARRRCGVLAGAVVMRTDGQSDLVYPLTDRRQFHILRCGTARRGRCAPLVVGHAI